MHKRRSLFVTGVLLSALVLSGATAAQAQPDPPTALASVALGHDTIVLSWTRSVTTTVTGYEIGWVINPTIGTVTVDNFDSLNPAKKTVGWHCAFNPD